MRFVFSPFSKYMPVKSIVRVLCLVLTIGVGESLAQSYVPEENNGKFKIKPVAEVKAYSFNLSDVQLLKSQFTVARDKDVTYLLAIEPDRLLSQFRTNAGL